LLKITNKVLKEAKKEKKERQQEFYEACSKQPRFGAPQNLWL
jgi:hypothetical protein